MKTIAFYISSHGFGHTTRNIPIIQALLELDKEIHVVVKTEGKQLQFIKDALCHYGPRITYFDICTDIGLILSNGSLQIDRTILEKQLKEYIGTWNEKVNLEKEFLTNNDVDLIVSDICPWVFKSAAMAAVKSVLISNFTWVEIYKELFNHDIYNVYKECYRLANYAYLYPLANNHMKRYFKNIIEIGMSCRQFDKLRVDDIKKRFNKPMVYVSVGRSVCLQDEIEVEGLPYEFVCTEGITLKGNNVHNLPLSTNNTQDFVKAADYILTKAGWSTVAEAICARKPMLVIDREDVFEDRTTLENLIKLDIALPIGMNQFNSEHIESLLTELARKGNNYNNLSFPYTECSRDISKNFLSLLNGGGKIK